MQWLQQGRAQDFSLGAKPKGPRPRADGVLGEGGSNPSLPATGSEGALSAPLAGFGTEPRPANGFPLFSALRMASPDTIVLLIVDYHPAIGGLRPPCSPRCVRPWVTTATRLGFDRRATAVRCDRKSRSGRVDHSCCASSRRTSDAAVRRAGLGRSCARRSD